jgi:hypothetical protein
VIEQVDPDDDFMAVLDTEAAMKQTAQRRTEEVQDIRESLRGMIIRQNPEA